MTGTNSNIEYEPITEYIANGTYTLMDGQIQSSERIFGYPFLPLLKFGQTFTYEIKGDELTLKYNKEEEVVNANGVERSYKSNRTTKWIKQ